jgi:hypothetical protein
MDIIFRATAPTDTYSLQFGEKSGFNPELNKEYQKTGGRFQIDLINKTCRPVETIEGIEQAGTVTGFYNFGKRLTLRKAETSNTYSCTYNNAQKSLENLSSVTVSFRESEIHAKFERLIYLIESRNEFVRLLIPPQ